MSFAYEADRDSVKVAWGGQDPFTFASSANAQEILAAPGAGFRLLILYMIMSVITKSGTEGDTLVIQDEDDIAILSPIEVSTIHRGSIIEVAQFLPSLAARKDQYKKVGMLLIANKALEIKASTTGAIVELHGYGLVVSS